MNKIIVLIMMCIFVSACGVTPPRDYILQSKEIERIPAEIWRLNENEISKVFVKDKKVINIKLDPYLETADTDVSDNNFPRLVLKSNFDKFKKRN